MADQPAQATSNKQLLLQKIYIKDLSFESPKAPEVFRSNEQANTQLNVQTKNRKVEDDHYEVALTLTVESKQGEDTLFLIEIVQSGVFTISGYNEQELQVLLGSFCPGSLYPFAREAVAEIASKGGFPQLLLQPINFDAVYAQAMQQRQAQEQSAAGEIPPVSMPGEASNGEASNEGGGETH